MADSVAKRADHTHGKGMRERDEFGYFRRSRVTTIIDDLSYRRGDPAAAASADSPGAKERT